MKHTLHEIKFVSAIVKNINGFKNWPKVGEKVQFKISILRRDGSVYVEFYDENMKIIINQSELFPNLPTFLSRFETNTRFVLIEKTCRLPDYWFNW